MKPCLCGKNPELVANTVGWEAEEVTFYKYRCIDCHITIGCAESRAEAEAEWDTGIEIVRKMRDENK